MQNEINKKNETVLDVQDLKVHFKTSEGLLKAVDGISFTLEKKGKTLGLVGESGCGKSLTSKALIRINPKKSQLHGQIHYYSDHTDPKKT